MQYCTQPGCSVLVPRGRCPQHAGVRRWYYTIRWARLRQQVLMDQAYTCAHCGHVQLDMDIDHIRPHDNHPAWFWSRANLQALCKPCHTRKTRRGE